MTSAPWLEIQRVKSATIPEYAALDLINDIDDAVRRRDVVSLRQFAAEAALSGMDQEASRAREIADVIDKAATSGRDEVLRLKAAIEPPPPSDAELARKFDQEHLAAAMSRGAPFNVNTFAEDEARRVETQSNVLEPARVVATLIGG